MDTMNIIKDTPSKASASIGSPNNTRMLYTICDVFERTFLVHKQTISRMRRLFNTYTVKLPA